MPCAAEDRDRFARSVEDSGPGRGTCGPRSGLNVAGGAFREARGRAAMWLPAATLKYIYIYISGRSERL